MLIIRKENVQKSIIIDKRYNHLVEKLPRGLKDRLTRLLNKMPIGSINILNKKKPEEAILKINNEKISLEEKNIEEFVKQINLLIWFLEPHWKSMGNMPRRNNIFFCADCNASVSEEKILPQKCPNANCSSHRKLRLILGKNYKKPKKIQRNSPYKTV